MLAFPMMIAESAKKGGIQKVPEEEDFDPNEFVHFDVLCTLSLGQPISFGSVYQWIEHNAKVLSEIPEEELKTLTMGQLVARGVEQTCF